MIKNKPTMYTEIKIPNKAQFQGTKSWRMTPTRR